MHLKQTKKVRDIDRNQSKSPSNLASYLLDSQAIQRFQRLTLAWRKFNVNAPDLSISEQGSIEAAVKYFKLSQTLDDSSSLRGLLSLVARIQAGRRLDELKPEGKKCRPRNPLYQAYTQIAKKITYQDFKRSLSTATSLNTNLGGLIVFLPFAERGKIGVRDFQRANDITLQNHLAAHPHFRKLSQVGDEFVGSIFANGEFPTRIWENYPFGEDLPVKHQVELLGIEGPTLPREYQLDWSERIVTVQPVIALTPSSAHTPLSIVRSNGGTADNTTTGSTAFPALSESPSSGSPPSNEAAQSTLHSTINTQQLTNTIPTSKPFLLPTLTPSLRLPVSSSLTESIKSAETRTGRTPLPNGRHSSAPWTDVSIADFSSLYPTSENNSTQPSSPISQAASSLLSLPSSGNDEGDDSDDKGDDRRDGVGGTTEQARTDTPTSNSRTQLAGDGDLANGGGARRQLFPEESYPRKRQKIGSPAITLVDSPLSTSSPTLVPSMFPWLDDALSSLDRLDEGSWLNDAIINAYMHILAERHNEICFLNSHLFGQHRLQDSWKAETGHPLDSDLVLTPINEADHWYLLVMYQRAAQNGRVVCFLDSLGSSSASHNRAFTRWTEYLSAHGISGVSRKYITVPKQVNGDDCGVYLLGFVGLILEGFRDFIKAVEDNAELGWTINAAKLRRSIRSILAEANGPAAPGVVATKSDDDVCMDSDRVKGFSACHLNAPEPKPLRPALMPPTPENAVETTAGSGPTTVSLTDANGGDVTDVETVATFHPVQLPGFSDLFCTPPPPGQTTDACSNEPGSCSKGTRTRGTEETQHIRAILDAMRGLELCRSSLVTKPEFQSFAGVLQSHRQKHLTDHTRSTPIIDQLPAYRMLPTPPSSVYRDESLQTTSQNAAPACPTAMVHLFDPVLPVLPCLDKQDMNVGQGTIGKVQARVSSTQHQTTYQPSLIPFNLPKQKAIESFGTLASCQDFSLVTLDNPFDDDNNLGAYISFTVTWEMAGQLFPLHPHPLPDNIPTGVEVDGTASRISKTGVSLAFEHLTLCHLTLPELPHTPYIVLWVTSATAKRIVANYNIAS